MAKSTPQQAASKWANRLSSSTDIIQQGIMNVQTAPGQKAAAKTAKMRANLLASIDSGKWAQRVGSVTLQDWQQATIQKGLPRIGQGATAAQGKMGDFLGQLFSYQDAGLAKINSMPDTTASDNQAKMVAWFQYMSNFKRK